MRVSLKTCACIALLVGLSAAYSDARAATYAVYSCRTPSGSQIGHSGWTRATETNDPTAQTSFDCANGGLTLATDMSAGHLRGSEVGLQWTAAPDTTIVGTRLTHKVFAPGVLGTWGWQYRVGAIDATTDKRFDSSTCLWPETACAHLTEFEGEGHAAGGRRVSKMLVTAYCTTWLPNDCPASPGPRISIDTAAFTIEDMFVPIFAAPPTGSLIQPASPLEGMATVGIEASDRGGGLLRAEIEVDGTTVSTRPFDNGDGRCTPPFSTPAPCPNEAAGVMTLDTTMLNDGPHLIALHLVDATGVNRSTFGPWSVTTRNGPEEPAAGHLSTPTCPRNGARAVRLHIEKQAVRMAGTVAVSGNVVRRVRGDLARVVLFGDSQSGLRYEVSPNDRGRFRARVEITASQRIRAAAQAVDGRTLACSRPQSIWVRASTSIRPSRGSLDNGQSLELSGQLAYLPVPGSGKLLRVQVRAAGTLRWFTAAELRSGDDGAWSWRHRFTRTVRPTTYVFRIVVPKQKGYPFARGRSRSVRVRVAA